MNVIKVGDKVRWDTEGYEVVLAVTSTHAFVVGASIGGTIVQRVPLSELTLVQSAPKTSPSPGVSGPLASGAHDAVGVASGVGGSIPPAGETLVEEALKQRESLLAENARLREALQMAVDTLDDDKWLRMRDGHSNILAAAAALGIRPKEAP